jgi:hypothetical protein
VTAPRGSRFDTARTFQDHRTPSLDIDLNRTSVSLLDDPRRLNSPRKTGTPWLLRQATAADHETLDSLASRLFDDEPTYFKFVTGSANALAPMEEALIAAGVEDALPERPRRAPSSALRQDLETFGATAANPVRVPACWNGNG